jgi:DNA-binding transcriptional LysR family regulator
VCPRLALDHAPSVVDAALAGLGVTQAFDHMVEALVRAGKLVALFPDEVADGPPIHAVCAAGRHATPRVRPAFQAFASAFGAA